MNEEDEWILQQHERLDHLELELEYEEDNEDIVDALDAMTEEVNPYRYQPNYILTIIGLVLVALGVLSLSGNLESSLTSIMTVPFGICILWAIWKFFTEDVFESGCFKPLLIAIGIILVFSAIVVFFESIGFWGGIITIIIGILACVFGLLGLGSSQVETD